MVSQPVVSLRYRVGTSPDAWVLPEGPVPESTAHDAALNHIHALLVAWAARVANGARIARNLAFRWLPEHPKTGLDPDVAVLLPGPPDFDDLTSIRLWEPGRAPPPFAVEVVSGGHPYKDYARVHEGYAAMGVAELLVFDPMLFGPKALGGPVLLQLWQRDVSGAFERVHFGNDPVYSRVLDAWIRAEGRHVQISDDRAGTRRWPTLVDEAKQVAAAAQAEAAQARTEAERSKSEAERSKAEVIRMREARELEQALRQELEQKVRELEAAQGKKA